MTDGRGYEFTPDQNAVFRRLAGAMSFVGAAMSVPGVIVAVTAVYLAVVKGPQVAEALGVVLGVLLLVMAVNLIRAAQHFHRIATTKGHDIENLMVAVAEMTRVYAIERWLWIAFGIVLIVALATGVTAG